MVVFYLVRVSVCLVSCAGWGGFGCAWSVGGVSLIALDGCLCGWLVLVSVVSGRWGCLWGRVVFLCGGVVGGCLCR